MASTDARPVPQKNVAFRVTFPILDADGDLVTGATGLDSEVSKDGGTFADATSEATEIATASGMYYLDLTSTEMNADTVAVIVKTTSSGAKTTPIVMYPEEAGDIRVNATQINSVSASSVTTINANVGTTQPLNFTGTGASALVKGDAVDIAGAAVSTSTAQVGVNVIQAAGTAWASGSLTSGVFASGAITATAIAADAIGASELATDAVTEIQSGLATSASISALNNLSAAQVNAEVVDALNVDTYAEPGQGTPTATTTLAAKIGYLYKTWRNKKEQTATTHSIYNDAGSVVDQKSTVSDDGTTATRGKIATGP